MSISADLRNYFLSRAEIAAQIGDRLTPYRVDSNEATEWPCALYQISLPIPSKDLRVVNQEHWETDFVIGVTARDTGTITGYDRALGVAALFRNAFDCFQGRIGSLDIKWVRYDHSQVEHELNPETFTAVVAFTIYSVQEPNFLT